MAEINTVFGIELPVFTEPRMLLTAPSSRDTGMLIAGVDKPKFVRKIDIEQKLSQLSVAELIDVAENEFPKIARYCGATVIEHTWGVVQSTRHRRDTVEPQPRIQDGFEFVAEVATIYPTTIWNTEDEPELNQQILQGLDLYEDALSAGDWAWDDRRSDQFVFGHTRTIPADGFTIYSPNTLFLSDIDINFERVI